MKFSIIVPVYFYNYFVENMLHSIRVQDFPNFELVIVCNNMERNEFYRVNREVKKILSSPRIQVKFIYTEKKGANNARMEGFQDSTGEYVFFLDSDDQLVHDQVLKNTSKVINAFSPDIISFNLQHARIINEKDVIPEEVIYDYVRPDQLLSYKKNPEIVTKNFGTNICSRFIKRKLLENIHFLDLPYYQDWNVSSKVFLRAQTFYFMQQPGYYWVYRSNSISKHSSMSIGKHLASFQSIIDITLFYNQLENKKSYKYFINDRIVKFSFSYIGRSYRFDINEGLDRTNELIKREVHFDSSFFKNERIVAMYVLMKLKPLLIFILKRQRSFQ